MLFSYDERFAINLYKYSEKGQINLNNSNITPIHSLKTIPEGTPLKSDHHSTIHHNGIRR